MSSAGRNRRTPYCIHLHLNNIDLYRLSNPASQLLPLSPLPSSYNTLPFPRRALSSPNLSYSTILARGHRPIPFKQTPSSHAWISRGTSRSGETVYTSSTISDCKTRSTSHGTTLKRNELSPGKKGWSFVPQKLEVVGKVIENLAACTKMRRVSRQCT